MIKVENIETWGFEHAIRGCRNPLNSWDKSDSHDGCIVCEEGCGMCADDNCDHYSLYMNRAFYIGKNDLDLMKRLYKAGTEHRKYARQIFVSMDITAPLYWWKEMDQYRISVTTNSCSTMHKIHDKEFTLDDFSAEYIDDDVFKPIIEDLNFYRNSYNNYDEYVKELEDMGFKKDEIPTRKNLWYAMIQLLPSSYNQRRTITMNYENVFSIIKQRVGHKLDEWNDFVEILKGLPYVEEIIE